MRILTWNVRRATSRSAAWDYFQELAPDLALLQEVGSIPPSLQREFSCVLRPAAGKSGRPQRFATAILAKGEIHEAPVFSTDLAWVNRELRRFEGNLVAHRITLVNGEELNAMSVYSPAWPVPADRLSDVDVTVLKLANSRQFWVTELLYAALRSVPNIDSPPWVVAGDLNSSETFDDLWPGGPHGNREVLARMSSLGLVESLRHAHGRLVPTFRDPRAGRIIHQIDHLFLSASLARRLASCESGDQERVLQGSLSDHLPIIANLGPDCIDAA